MNNSYQNTIGNRWRGYFLSAYGIAVKHGFIGNEEDWLLSLTAYGIALKLGFEGTQEEWIASLKGEKGDPFKYEDFTPEQLEALRNEIAGAFFAEAEALKESAEEAASNAEKSKESAEEAASNAEKSKEAAEAAAVEAQKALGKAEVYVSQTSSLTVEAGNHAAEAERQKDEARSAVNEAMDWARFTDGRAENAAESAANAAESAEVAKANTADIKKQCANALRGKLSGTIVRADDVSPIEHELDIKLTGENVEGTVVKQYGKNILENHNAVGSIVSYPHLASAKGVSFERLSDGGIHVISTGENTSNVGYYFDSNGNYVANKLRDGVDYILSPHNPVDKLYFYISYKDENGVMKYRDRVKWSDKYSNASFYFQVDVGAPVDTIVYPMLEIGTTATEFEPFREPTTAVADAEGNVSGLMSLAPSMTLITDNEGAVIECAYNRDTNKVIEELTNAIISLEGNI